MLGIFNQIEMKHTFNVIFHAKVMTLVNNTSGVQ